MKTIKKYPSREYFSSFFKYDDDGSIIRIKNRKSYKAGRIAGRPNRKGYLRVCVEGREYYCHRVVYILHFGEIPLGMQIDHINGIKHDNRIENLRPATNSQNKMNSGLRADNTTGYKGITRKNNGWQVCVMISGKNTYIGVYNDISDAVKARNEAYEKNYKEFACCL